MITEEDALLALLVVGQYLKAQCDTPEALADPIPVAKASLAYAELHRSLHLMSSDDTAALAQVEAEMDQLKATVRDHKGRAS